ncbi:MAG TPA: PRC-barrel domain-containing protein [Thermodesulfobacteriota bacterium]|nr:PRC-barrel domain-containing protein [Thermodesulfobacteriota bacterium]
MNKTQRILLVLGSIFSLVFLGSSAFSQGLSGQYPSGNVGTAYQPMGWSEFDASWLIGHHLLNPTNNANLGQISDLFIDRCGGRVAFVVLSDTPGAGSENLAVPFESLMRTGEQTFQLTFGDKDVPMASHFQSRDILFQDRYTQYLVENKDIIGVKANQGAIDLAWAEAVYKVYGLEPYWTGGKTSQPDMESYIMNRANGDPRIHYPGGGLVASSGTAPFWASCGCGAEAVNFGSLTEPALPSFAKPGECYARVYIPARCETVSEQVMTRAASERVETIPAKYEVFEERVMVTPASKKIEAIPAEYKTVEEKVLVEPAHSEWREGRGSVEKMDQATGKIMCLVEVPATYKTVQKQVLVKEASTREVEIPAQYEMRKVNKMVEPSHENHIQIPAEYKTVTRTEKVADGYLEWQKVEGCHTD